MRFTLGTLLSAWLAIYCNNSVVVLSLPPSLIAKTAALRQQTEQQESQHQQQQQQQQQHYISPLRWKKDARILQDGGNGGSGISSNVGVGNSRLIGDMMPSTGNRNVLQQQQQQQRQVKPTTTATTSANFNRKLFKEYDLDAMLNAAAAAADAIAEPTTIDDGRQSMPQEITPPSSPPPPPAQRFRALDTLKYYTPFKYWTRHCQASKNCPEEFYRAIMATRNRASTLRSLHKLSDAAAASGAGVTDSIIYDSVNGENVNMDSHSDEENNNNDDDDDTDNNDDDDDEDINNEIFMLLSAEEDLINFLHWAMELLYPYKHYKNFSEHEAENYHPSMFIWKKLNLSGHLEPPLVVEEPRYVLVRREPFNEHLQFGDDKKKYGDDPFIPPRGRKHHMPDLDALLQRFETFVPNRGKRGDKIKDIFKYDDLFYPNRGKKHRDLFKIDDDPFFPNRGKKLNVRDIFKVDDPFFPNRGKRHGNGNANKRSVNDVNANDNNDDDIDDEEGIVSTDNSRQHLTWLNGVAAVDAQMLLSSPTPPLRIFGKLKRKLQQKQQQWQHQHQQQQQQEEEEQQQHIDVANEISSNNDDVFDDDNNNNDDDDDEDQDNDNDVDEVNVSRSNNNNNNNNSEWPQRMSTHKINGYDQSVKPSMSSAATTLTALNEDGATKRSTMLQQHVAAIEDQNRVRRFNAGASNAARLAAANRLHSTRSMSTNSQLQQQQRHTNQRQQQQQQSQQQHQLQQLQHLSNNARQHRFRQQQKLSPQVQENLRFITNAAAAAASMGHQHPYQHQVKSTMNNDLEPLFWRQLQQLQQKRSATSPGKSIQQLLWQHQHSSRQPKQLQHSRHDLQHQQQLFLPELPLTHVTNPVAPDRLVDDINDANMAKVNDNDIDYTNFDI